MQDEYNDVRRDLDALHAPRLPGALRRGLRALHLPVPRRRLRLRGQGLRRPAGPAARSLLHPRAQRQRRGRPALQPELRARALLAARSRGCRSTASASTSTRPVPPSASSRGRRPWRSLQRHPGCAASPTSRARARTRSRRRPPKRRQARRDRRLDDRLARRAHVAVGRRALDDVPQDPARDELVLHARLRDDVRVPLAGRDRRLPRDVLRPVGDARLRVDALPHQRGLPRRVRARHAQVGLDRHGHPHLPAHGRARSSSAPTSTPAS